MLYLHWEFVYKKLPELALATRGARTSDSRNFLHREFAVLRAFLSKSITFALYCDETYLDVEVAVVRVGAVVVVEDDVDALGEPREPHDGEELHKQQHLLASFLRVLTFKYPLSVR